MSSKARLHRRTMETHEDSGSDNPLSGRVSVLAGATSGESNPSSRVIRTTSSTRTETTHTTTGAEHGDSENVDVPSTPQNVRKGSPSGGGTASANRTHSPFSIRRHEEKEELAHLNDRLAYYIDYVRSLESQKDSMKRQIKSYSESQVTEVNNIKKLYDTEMASLRNALDEIAREKAACEVELKKARGEREEMKGQLGRKERECDMFERQLRESERLASQYKGDHDKFLNLKQAYDELMKQYEQLKKQLEKETILRVNLENQLQTLKEQLTFQDGIHKQQCQTLYERTIHIEEEVAGKKQAEFETKLADELRAMREQTQEEMEIYKINIEATFEGKMAELKRITQQNTPSTSEFDALEYRLRDLQTQLDRERADHAAQIKNHVSQNDDLRNELQKKFQEFNDLMNIKIALDQEIMAYRKLLEGEEARCHLSPKESISSPFGEIGKSTKKRKHAEEDEDFDGRLSSRSVSKSFKYRGSAVGHIEIIEVDASEGKFVKVKNSSADKTINLGGWQLKYQSDADLAGEHPQVVYKFNRQLTLKPEQVSTVWSSDQTAVTHSVPTDLLMKGGLKFPAASHKVQLQLVDAEGALQAELSAERQYLMTATIGSTSRGIRRTGSSDDESKPGEEKCSIM